MRKLLIALFIFFSYSISYSNLHAQDAQDSLLKKLVEKQVLTQDEANELQREEQASTTTKKRISETSQKIRQAFNTPAMRFGGYGLFLYRYSDVAPIHHSAEPKVIVISMKGDLSKTINYFVLAEFVNPMPYEFYTEWTPSKAFKLKAGQMKTPLSLENAIALFNMETVSNTRSVSNLIGMTGDVQQLQNGKNNSGRDIGIQVAGTFAKSGDHDLVEYAIGMFQGTGLNTRETNNNVDLAANVLLQPAKGFRIGGGSYFGEATYKQLGEIEANDHVRNRWVLSSDYRSEKLYARAEYLHGNDGGISKEGMYGTAVWSCIPNKLNVVGKLDYFNKNKATNSEVVDYTLGFSYYFYPQCRIQFDYTYSDYSSKWGAKKANVVLGQLQVVF